MAPLKDKEELPGLVRTRRVVITPLRVILHPPQLEETNRILRQCAPPPSPLSCSFLWRSVPLARTTHDLFIVHFMAEVRTFLLNSTLLPPQPHAVSPSAPLRFYACSCM